MVPGSQKKTHLVLFNLCFLPFDRVTKQGDRGYWPIWEEFSSDGQQDSWPSPINLFSMKKTQHIHPVL